MRHILSAAFILAAPILATTAVLNVKSGLHAQPATQTADTVLAANHAAVGDVPAAGGAEFDYDWAGSGLTGTHVDIADLATGAFVSTEQAGAIADANGYDGAVPWQRDLSGANTAQQGGDRIPVAVNAAYRLANLWWRPGRGGATIMYAGQEAVDGKVLDRLTVAPRGGKLFEAWFDAGTHLLVKVAEDRQFFHVKTTYGDYRPEGAAQGGGGQMLAHSIAVDTGQGEEGIDRLKLTRFAIGPSRPLTTYAKPETPPPGGSIEAQGANGNAASVTVPFRLLNNHIYVQVSVNGRGPYTFIVDTGGHTLLSPRLVKEVGLTSVGAAAESGAGEGHEVIGFTQVKDIAVGAVHLRDQVGIAAPVYDKAIEDIPVDGMVGFELFARFAVTIDYEHQTLTFTDFAKFDGKDKGTPVPFVFYDHLPNVRGFIDAGANDEIAARFDIDSGSRSELDITSPTVAEHGLRAKFDKGVSAVTGWGVGGPSRSYVVRLPSITLGTVKVADLVAGLSENKGGSISDPNYEGNVGSAFLKRFTVTFDYAHQTMYLKPVVPLPVDAGRFDRAGMWINAGDAGYAVTDIAANGPAAQAGLAVGDVITAIDDKPAVAEGLSDARIMLRARPAGTSLKIAVTRGAEKKTVTLVLKDQI